MCGGKVARLRKVGGSDRSIYRDRRTALRDLDHNRNGGRNEPLGKRRFATPTIGFLTGLHAGLASTVQAKIAAG